MSKWSLLVRPTLECYELKHSVWHSESPRLPGRRFWNSLPLVWPVRCTCNQQWPVFWWQARHGWSLSEQSRMMCKDMSSGWRRSLDIWTSGARVVCSCSCEFPLLQEQNVPATCLAEPLDHPQTHPGWIPPETNTKKFVVFCNSSAHNVFRVGVVDVIKVEAQQRSSGLPIRAFTQTRKFAYVRSRAAASLTRFDAQADGFAELLQAIEHGFRGLGFFLPLRCLSKIIFQSDGQFSEREIRGNRVVHYERWDYQGNSHS